MKKKIKIDPKAFVIDGNNVWCVDDYYNALFCLEKGNNTISESVSIPQRLMPEADSRYILLAYHEYVLLIHNNASTLEFWNTIDKKWISYELLDERVDGYCMFSQAQIVKDTLYLFPGTYGYAMQFDLIEKKVTRIIDIFSIIDKLFSVKLTTINPPCWIDVNKVVGCTSQSKDIFEYNVDDGNIERVGITIEGLISSVASIGHALILYDKARHTLHRINKNNYNYEKEHSLEDKKYRISVINAKCAVVDTVDSDDFFIIDENFEILYSHRGAKTVNCMLVDGVGSAICGEKVGYYYSKLLKKLYKIGWDGTPIEEIDFYNQFTIDGNKTVMFINSPYNETNFLRLDFFIEKIL